MSFYVVIHAGLDSVIDRPEITGGSWQLVFGPSIRKCDAVSRARGEESMGKTILTKKQYMYYVITVFDIWMFCLFFTSVLSF